MYSQDVREVQVGIFVLGYRSLGELDGWWGRKTAAAAQDLLAGGPRTSSRWAVTQLQQGLYDLGYPVGRVDGFWGPKTRNALAMLIKAGGKPYALQIITGKDVETPDKSDLTSDLATRPLMRGTTAVDTLYLHTSATSERFLVGKTNGQIFDAIRNMHVLPKSQGGNGWSDIGYNDVCCPDGEIIAGRPIERVPAAVLGHNTRSLHLCMVPVKTITRMGVATDFYTDAQIEAAKGWIERQFGVTVVKRLRGHNEDAAKLCPGFVVHDKEWTTRAVL